MQAGPASLFLVSFYKLLVNIMRLGILGKGAIGSLLAAKCQVIGIPFTLLTRNSEPFDLAYQLIDGQSGYFTPRICNPDITETFDVLLVATKAFDVGGALEQWRNKIDNNTLIVLMNNGMGPHESVAEHFPHNPVVAVLTSYGAHRPNENQVIETGEGNSAGGWLLAPNEQQEFVLAMRIIELFDRLFPPFVWHVNVHVPLWQKLAINAVINPLTALHKIPNGHLATSLYQNMIGHLIEELRQVMEAEGINITASTLNNTVNSVIAGTAKNISSMYQDVIQGRRTEIDLITGYILKVAKRHGVPMPHHQSLYNKIKLLETPSEPAVATEMGD